MLNEGKGKSKNAYIYMPNVRKVNFKKNGKAMKGLTVEMLLFQFVSVIYSTIKSHLNLTDTSVHKYKVEIRGT